MRTFLLLQLFGVITSSLLSTKAITFDVFESLLFDFVDGFHVYPLRDVFSYVIVATYRAVSYTHLDVYKRQGLDSED